METFIFNVLIITLIFLFFGVLFYWQNIEFFEGTPEYNQRKKDRMKIEERLLQYLLPEATKEYIEVCKALYKKDNLVEETTLTEARFIEEVTNKYLEDIRTLELAPVEMEPIFKKFYQELIEKYKRDPLKELWLDSISVKKEVTDMIDEEFWDLI